MDTEIKTEQMLENYLKIANTSIESLEAEYETYNLENLKFAHEFTIDMFKKLIEGTKIFKGKEERQKIQDMCQKLLSTISNVNSLCNIKEKERLSQLSKEETNNILKDKLIQLEKSFINLLNIGQSNLKFEDEPTNNLIKITFEAYIKECDRIKSSLGGYNVNLEPMTISQNESDNLKYKCEKTITWFGKNRNMFDTETFDKILIKLLNTYKYILQSNLISNQ